MAIPKGETHTRREFLTTALATGLLGATCSHGGMAGSEAILAEIPTIDTHTHFYDPNRPQGVPWPSRDDPFLFRPVLPTEYRKLSRPLGVVGTVVVEASPWLEDNQWLLDLAESDPFLVGIVGQLSPGSPEFPRQLERFSANRLYRGIRIGGGDLTRQLEAQAFLAGLRMLKDQDLTLDINGGPEMLKPIAKLAAAIPDLKIVINHLANVRIDGQAPPPEWRADLLALKQHPRVWCKVSALVEGASRPDEKSPTRLDHYRPVFETAFEAFGERRLIYGSNWPVSARFNSYQEVHQLALELAREHGKDLTRRLMHDNSRDAYNWLDRAS
jgi:predicted TIM-barrel fold metal-dependent hydrolase